MRKNVFPCLVAAVMMCLSFLSCKKDKLLTDSDVSLQFSEDTIKFDTVFTTVGSATRVFTVVNTYDQPVKISSIFLARGGTSYFRLNVDGIPGKSFSNVEIRANDSIWIFVEVTLDPNNINTPLLITDSIVFITNGHQQDVDLVSYGQDAHFHTPSTESSQPSACTPLFKLKNFATGNIIRWTNDKPHLIYGYAVVDAGYTLQIDSGTNVHFHNNSGLIVLSTGKIVVKGELASPVTFQGDRVGEDFKDIPGQWDRIWLSTIVSLDLTKCPIEVVTGFGPSGNVFDYAIIKNGYVGLQADSFAVPHMPAVVLNNCIVKNFASTALYGQGSNIQANNCVFANCGEYCTAMYFGGDYRFLHCTIANYWNQSSGNRQTPAVYMQNYYDVVRPLDSAYFGNCIIYGSLDNEIGLDSANVSGANFNFRFDHSLIKIDPKVSTSSAFHYNSIIKNADPFFDDVDNNNYQLGSTSIAIDFGDAAITNLNPILSKDLKGDARPQGLGADIGAYEKR